MKKALKNSTVIALLSAVSIIFLIGTAVSFIFDAYYNRKISAAETRHSELTINANLFMSGAENLTKDVRAYAATSNQEYYDSYWNEVNTVQSRENGVKTMKEIGISSEEQKMIDKMFAIANELTPLEEQAIKYAQKGKRDAAVACVYGDEYNAGMAQIEQLKNEFLNHIEERATEQIEELHKVCDALTQVVWFLICDLMALQIIYTVYNKRKMIKPVLAIEKEMGEIAKGNLHSEFNLVPDTSEIGLLVESIHRTKKTLKQYVGDISEKLSKMASGDMNQAIELEYIGDFKPIQDALTTILNSFNHILGEILRSSDRVAGEAHQVASGAQNLAQGATEQAASVEEISATITALSDRMNKVAENAQSARSISDNASDVLHVCNQKMQDLVSAMEQISTASSEIGKIIGTIENIAFQTNILALNAAVESSRAGEAGRGFAVVADEVRSLANKSQEAARSTGELISRALEAVDHGTQIVDDTAHTLIQVVEGVEQSTDYVDNIADASKEQSGALQQLTEGINQISNVVQNTSATSQQSAAASAELNEQAATMQHLMNSFELRRGRDNLIESRGENYLALRG